MSRMPTRARTRNGVLVVTDDHVRLERGAMMRRTVAQIPRNSITHIRLTSRFHGVPLVLGALLLAGSIALTLSAARPTALFGAPAPLFMSLALVSVVAGLFLLLCVPLTWQAVLEIASPGTRIVARTGYRRRPHLEKVVTHLNASARNDPEDLVHPQPGVNTPSGSQQGSV